MKRNDASEVMCIRHLAEDKIKEKLLKLYFLTGFSPISLSENVFKFSKKEQQDINSPECDKNIHYHFSGGQNVQ